VIFVDTLGTYNFYSIKDFIKYVEIYAIFKLVKPGIKSTPYVSCLNVDTSLQTPILFSIRLYPNTVLVDCMLDIVLLEINKLCSAKSESHCIYFLCGDIMKSSLIDDKDDYHVINGWYPQYLESFLNVFFN
jgi:hypothetical protein